MIEQITEKLDAIEVSNEAKIQAVKEEAVAAVEAAKAEFSEKVIALETKISQVQAPEIMRSPAKSVKQDVNRPTLSCRSLYRKVL